MSYRKVHEIGQQVDRYDCEPLGDRLLRVHEVPEDVCPRREAISGACILWMLIFALGWAVVGWLLCGWK